MNINLAVEDNAGRGDEMITTRYFASVNVTSTYLRLQSILLFYLDIGRERARLGGGGVEKIPSLSVEKQLKIITRGVWNAT